MSKLETVGYPHVRPSLEGNTVFSPNDIFASCLSVQAQSPHWQGDFFTVPKTVPTGSGSLLDARSAANIVCIGVFDNKDSALRSVTEQTNLWDSLSRTLVNCRQAENDLTPVCPTALVQASPSGSYQPTEILFDQGLTRYFFANSASLLVGDPPRTVTYEKLLGEIDELHALPPDWDGEGAVSISLVTAENAKALLLAIYKSNFDLWPSIGPMPDGRYSFTWEIAGKEIWVYVSDQGYTSHQWDDASQFRSSVASWQDPNMITELLEWLER